MTSLGRPLIEISGMTWAHPRGYAPLLALASIGLQDGPLGVEGSKVRWDRQDLADFESHSIAELAVRYDLLVIDHPGLGSAVAAGALRPLDELVSAEELGTWSDRYVGAALDSYFLNGHQGPVPIDAATQVSAFRPDLMDPPHLTWPEIADAAHNIRSCIPTKAPHVLLTFLGIAAAAEPGFLSNNDELVSSDTGELAFVLLSELFKAMPRELHDLDPIGVLEAMSLGDSAFCPLLYGYVNYSRPDDGRARVLFSDAPRWPPGLTPGSVLGGTGLSISGYSTHLPAALDHLRQISSERAQLDVVPRVGGQPSTLNAWLNPQVDECWGNFYSATLTTQLAAWRRPRYDGWIRLQNEASVFLFDALVQNAQPDATVAELNRRYRLSRHALE